MQPGVTVDLTPITAGQTAWASIFTANTAAQAAAESAREDNVARTDFVMVNGVRGVGQGGRHAPPSRPVGVALSRSGHAHVAERDGEDAGKLAHYMMRWVNKQGEQGP